LAKLLPVLVSGQRAGPRGSAGLKDVRDQMTGENFPVALRLLPPAPRRDLTRVYAYARFVDDLGDEADGDRLARLDEVEADVRGPATLAPVAGIAPLIRSSRVPLQPFLDLIEANRRDQHTAAYATFDDLLEYCRYSAARRARGSGRRCSRDPSFPGRTDVHRHPQLGAAGLIPSPGTPGEG